MDSRSATTNTNAAQLTGIFRATIAAGPMESLTQAEVVAGTGLQGDRYATGQGTFSVREGIREITLIAEEKIEAYASFEEVGEEAGSVAVTGADMRRNFLTRGVDLPELVGRRFRVGGALLLGVRLCPPCTHLGRLLGTQAILRGFAHSGGIYAQVLESGRVELGSPILLEEGS